jgi:hypothetical protein
LIEVHHELAADDERLLVRQREGLARLQRRERRAEPGRADERVQHQSASVSRRALGGVGPDDELDALEPPELRLDVAGGLLVGDRDVGGRNSRIWPTNSSCSCRRATARRP